METLTKRYHKPRWPCTAGLDFRFSSTLANDHFGGAGAAVGAEPLRSQGSEHQPRCGQPPCRPPAARAFPLGRRRVV